MVVAILLAEAMSYSATWTNTTTRPSAGQILVAMVVLAAHTAIYVMASGIL